MEWEREEDCEWWLHRKEIVTETHGIGDRPSKIEVRSNSNERRLMMRTYLPHHAVGLSSILLADICLLRYDDWTAWLGHS